ncbi:MAG: hypothetical protein IJI44_08045 [Erysipelotrichaceae bacterium]|nr:hypothetical protein [Erysipelotrichaceae bacterium]
MGFTAWIGLIYLLLVIFAVYSFSRKKNRIGICLSIAMILGLLILGYLWFTSPM